MSAQRAGQRVRASPQEIRQKRRLTGITVSLSDLAATTNADPFVFDYLTIAAGMRTVSVPPVGYHLLGYSLCYNSWSCHGTVTAGNSATISDDLILTQDYVPGNVPYADLYWHYCQPPQAIPASRNLCCPGYLKQFL